MDEVLNFTLQELKTWMKKNGESEFRAKQVFDWIYNYIWNFNLMKNIPLKTMNLLEDNFITGIPEIVEKFESVDGSTTKFLMEYSDGNVVESVVMKYKHGYTICVSTQIGCRMGCKFCASTIEGMVRNLSSGEILGEILAAQKNLNIRISNVVLMGSGEPFDNFDNVIKFINCANAEYGLNIGQRHITISTCGIVPKIKELADMDMQITLAISLHAPNDELRRTMMPIANKYSINDILEACKYYISRTNKRVTFEYALVHGVNDSEELAYQLASILKGMLCHINLIPVNEIAENNLKKSSKEHIHRFCDILERNGIETTIRREMGNDISAACGQLRRSYLGNKNK